MLSVAPLPARLLFLLALAAPGAAQTVQRVEREVILSVPRAADRRAVESRLALEGCVVIDELPALGLWLVALPDELDVPAAVKRLGATRGVGFAEKNGWGEAGGVAPPDDTYFGEQWPLRNTGQEGGKPGADIEAVLGWELTRGSPGVIVAVLDSGLVVDHPEFTGRTLPGVSFVASNPNPSDDNGHGTAAAGLLAANADNGFAIAGVDHRCTILPIKVLDRRGHGGSFWLAQGLVYAADAGADVISMSVIGFPDNESLNLAVQYAYDAGCVLVACAGNGGIGDADVSFPGSSPLVISVAASTRFDDRADFSATGRALDLLAPGFGDPATVRETTDSFRLFGGCSAATPIVAGVAALALALDPTLTNEEVRALLAAGAEDQIGPPLTDLPGRDDFFGHGRVNLLRTLCGLDGGGPEIVGPDALRIEATAPGELDGDDPAVTEALAMVSAVDDLDPDPELRFDRPASLVLGRTVPVVFTGADACGNETQRTVGLTLEDTRAPLLLVAAARDQLWPPNHALVSVGLQAEASDAGDLAPALELLIYADEPGDASGSRRPAARIEPGGGVFLRAERDGKGDGRVYLCLVRATDDSGNTATSCATVVVPHDASRGALEDVRQQAERAERECLRTGEPPAGFSLLASSTQAR